MKKSFEIFHRKEKDGQESFNITVSDAVTIGGDNTVCCDFHTVEEDVESLTYTRLTAKDLLEIGSKFIEAGLIYS